MEILYLLVPLSVAIAFAIIAALAWSVWSGQFDDVERHAGRALELDKPDDPPRGPGPGT